MRRFHDFRVASIVAVLAICTGISFCAFVNVAQVKETMPIACKLTVPSPASVPGSSDPASDEWPMFRGALNHTGVAMTIPAQGAGPSWIYTTSTSANDIISSPAVSGGRMYIGGDQRKLDCLNATTGLLLWSYTMGQGTMSSPAVASGRVYVGSDDNKIYCLNATTGTLLWSYTTGLFIDSSPAVSCGRVYVGSYDDKIYCLNAITGALIWNYTTGGQIFSSPAIAGGLVYVGVDKIYCLNATTGAFAWSFTPSRFLESSPAVAGGRVYAMSYDGNVYCLNSTTGALSWSYKTNNFVESSPAIAEGCVYLGNNGGRIFCLNATTGTFIWSYKTGGYVRSAPAVAAGRVYVGSWDGKVYCLNATTGEFVWSYYTSSSGMDSSPAIASGYLFVGGGDAKVYCLPMIMLPSTPRNLQASGGSGKIVLAWQAPAGNGGSPIMGYNIYRSTSTGGETLLTTINNVTVWTDTGVANGQAYYYEASATSAVGEGPLSNEANATPSLSILPPSAPRNLQVTTGNGQVVLSWQTPANNGGSAIIFYKIYRGTAPASEVLVATIGNMTAWTDTDVTNGQAYYYEASAVDGTGEGPMSNEASITPMTVPTAPQAFTATAGDGQVVLAWAAPTSNGGSAIMGYRIYQGTTPENEIFLANPGNVTTYTATGLTNGHEYYFIIQAVNAMGDGANSTEASATPATVPGAPLSLTAIPGNAKVVLNWTMPASNGGSPIMGYRIYQGMTPASETLLTIIGNVTTCTSLGLLNGQYYYFTIAAVNAMGTGVNSPEINTTPATVPDLPRNLVVSFGNSQVMLKWQEPSSNGGAAVTNYNIYRGTSTGKETLSATVGNVTIFVDTGLANGQAYYYEISAANTAGEGNRTSEVRASHRAPEAIFSVVSSTIYVNTPITIIEASRNGDSPIVAWSWSFGDNTSAVIQNATHAYAEPGTYTITLSVRDANGFENDATMIITVVAITSRQGLMGITAGLVVTLSAGVVIAVKLRKKSLKRDWIES